MNVAIIDADLIGLKKHRFPNLACMKISGYYKEIGCKVELKTDYENIDSYDKVFISKVFTDTPIDEELLNLPNVEYGGTGFYYDKAPNLPCVIEHHMPDYHLYDKWVENQIRNGGKRKDFEYYLDYSIGFTTRGCFRQCAFCVNKNYKKVENHSPIDEFYDDSRKYICMLDDNILGSPNWKDIFLSLQEKNKPFQFKQGMDERILNDEKCEVLLKSKYKGDYIFAFDNIDDKKVIIKKAELIRKYFKSKGQNIKFYVLCAFDKNNTYNEDFWIQDIKDTFERIFILSKYNFKPYIMRYNAYIDSNYYGTYVNLACWCNQPSLFMNTSYRDFCIKDDNRKSNGEKRSATWRYFEQINNSEFDKYLDIVPKDLVVNYWSE